MKARNLLIINVLALFFVLGPSMGASNDEKKQTPTGQVNLISTEQLKSLVNDWANNYSGENPSADLVIKTVPAAAIELNPGTDIAILNEADGGSIKGWKMTLGREVIVPVINASNPLEKTLFEKGVSKEGMRKLFQQQAEMSWGTLLGYGEEKAIKLYILNDQTTLLSLNKFLEINSIPGTAILMDSHEQIIKAVGEDPYALGFCNLTGIIDPGNNQFTSGIRILPLDKNGNGKLDNMENIYANAEAFERGVWIGKYPVAMANEIYAVSASEPAAGAQQAFLAWLLTNGQRSLGAFGISGLVYSEVQSKLDRIENINLTASPAANAISTPNLVLFIITAILLLGIIVGAIIGFGKKEETTVTPEYYADGVSFDEQSVKAPAGLFYDKSHTWAFMEKDGTVRAGIDDFIQHVTGPITRIEMKKPGDKVKKGELFLSLVQKGKQLDLYAPVSGTIIECNRMLDHNSTVLNTSPYSEGWVYRLQPAGWLQEITLLSMAEKYSRWISEEFLRLKDFLAATMQVHKMEYARVIMQDGGALKNNVLEEFGPEVWEDFQDKFIDACK